MISDRWSVLIISHFGGAPLLACIQSIHDQSTKAKRLLVVMTNVTAPVIAGVDVLCLNRKAHYAEGVNAGLKALNGDSILILNDDTHLAVDCLEMLSKEWSPDRILQPQIILKDTRQIDNLGHKIWPDGMNFAHQRGQRPDQNEVLDLMVFSGAAVAIPPNVYQHVGYFDPRLSPFGEDVDYALRAVRMGFKIRTCPSAKVSHRLGASYGRMNSQKIFWVERHRLLLMLKSAPPLLLALLPLSTTLRYGLQFYGGRKNKGTAPKPTFKDLIAIAKAYISAGRSAPNMLKSRKEAQEEWTITNRQMMQDWLQQLPSPKDIWHPPLESSSPPMAPNQP